GQVRKLDAVQLQAVIERREAERQAQICREERNNVIDVTTSLREALAERDNQAEKHNHQPVQEMIQGRTFNFEQEPEKLDSLVDDALKDIQDDIDLQSLINDSMAEFQGIHQEMVRQQERSVLAEKQRQQEKEWLRIAEQQRQKPDKGWSFSR
ncbi:relaxation protein, partial [Xenorhabdus bovienii]|nr:relaxation protein [Xenorhabdus bovienii]